MRYADLAVEVLPAIIEASVKPLEKIDGIKIVQVDGLNRGRAAEGTARAVRRAAATSPSKRWRRRSLIAPNSRFWMPCPVRSG